MICRHPYSMTECANFLSAELLLKEPRPTTRTRASVP
jgi:hypothetical protein